MYLSWPMKALNKFRLQGQGHRAECCCDACGANTAMGSIVRRDTGETLRRDCMRADGGPKHRGARHQWCYWGRTVTREPHDCTTRGESNQWVFPCQNEPWRSSLW